MNIKKVVVIGSGTMGSGIAAQVANAGISVTLLDLPSNEGSRNQITENAKDRILKSRPPLLVEKTKAEFIKTGNIEDDFSVCLFPEQIKQKDINEMVVSGVKDIKKLIDDNTYKGLEAKVRFNEWRKIDA